MRARHPAEAIGTSPTCTAGKQGRCTGCKGDGGCNSLAVKAADTRYLRRMEIVEVSVSCPDEEVAAAIGRAAVEARLVACAHIALIRSVYRWEGDIHSDPEWSLTLKSRADLFDRLADLVREMHPYDLPAIMSHPCGADEATAAWIAEATS